MPSTRLEPGTEEFELALEAEMARRESLSGPPSPMEMANARHVRESEKDAYLIANLMTYPDARERWDKYEKLILKHYGPLRQFPPERRINRLDHAWVMRDRWHSEGKE